MNSNLSQFKLLEGQVVDGKYRLTKLLGAGGFGAVFQADEVVRDRVLRQVAVKLIPPAESATLQTKQLNELQAAVNLDHPHIIRCFAAGEFSRNSKKDFLEAMLQALFSSEADSNQVSNSSFLYLVMELADYSLDSHLEKGVLSDQPLYQMIAQVANALDYLHTNALVHQDLKPGNVLWVKNVWKVSDFGTVRSLDTRSHVQTMYVIGTPVYMSPEAFRGVVSPAWDVWSLGVMSAVAATGNVPEALPKDALPSELKPLVRGCLQDNWRQRWTAKQALDAIAALSQSPPVQFKSQARTLGPQAASPKQDYQEILPGQVPLEMTVIPAGSFWMGSADGEGYDKERQQHYVTVPQLYMGKYPITNAQWRAVMQSDPSANYGRQFRGNRQPVINVSWYNAQAFCKKLSRLTGRRYRLPSEAEWEYACRAGSKTSYSFGGDESQLKNYAWHNGNSKRQTHPVGEKRSNTFGLYDMHGNVWEWCEDHWHDSYKNAPTDGSAWLSDENDHQNRIRRGGSWSTYPKDCCSATRFYYDASTRDYYIGFRVVCSAPRILR